MSSAFIIRKRLPTPVTSSASFLSAKSHSELIGNINTARTGLRPNPMAQRYSDLSQRTTMQISKEQLNNFKSSLDIERNRNKRLANLIRSVDSSSSSDSEAYDSKDKSGWRHSRSTIDAYESISPLLLQHRYQDLNASYRRCCRQLAKKDDKLRTIHCELDMLQTKYYNLLDEHKDAQQRVEELCCKYLRLHTNKNREISKLKEALGYASGCIMKDSRYDENDKEAFRRNLQLFTKALKTSVQDENRFITSEDYENR